MKKKLIVLLCVSSIFANDILDYEVLKELKKIDTTKKQEIILKQKNNFFSKNNQKMVKSVFKLYHFKEYNAAYILLKSLIDKNIELETKEMKLLLKYLKINKLLKEGKNIISEINYIKDMEFIDMFYIKGLTKSLSDYNKKEILIELLKNIKIKEQLDKKVNFNLNEKAIYGFKSIEEIQNKEEYKSMILAKLYEDEDFLLEAYDIYVKLNKKSKIKQTKILIKERLKIFASKKNKIKNYKEEIKGTNSLNIYKISRIKNINNKNIPIKPKKEIKKNDLFDF